MALATQPEEVMDTNDSPHARGFSLLEVAVASAIAGIVAAAAVSSFAVLNRQLVRLQAETAASDDAKTLVDFLVTDLQAVGGGSVRPWMALWVEDDGTATTRDANFGQATRTSDRVTYAAAAQNARTCTLVSMDATEVVAEGTGPSCCFRELRVLDKAGFAEPGPTDLNFHAVVVKGGASRQISVNDIDVTACSMKWKPGPLAGIDNLDGDNLIDAVDASVAPVADFGDQGAFSAVSIHTLYLDEVTHELFSHEERRGFDGTNVVIDPDEKKRIAANVYDLQVQLGYDGNPADGRLVDDGTAGDEWLYNNAGDGNLPVGVDLNDLRMTALGVVVGANVRDANYTTVAQVRGGAPKSFPGVHLRGTMGRAALRNIFVFF